MSYDLGEYERPETTGTPNNRVVRYETDIVGALSLNPPTASPGGGPGCGWWGVEGLGLVGFGGFRGCGGCGLVG